MKILFLSEKNIQGRSLKKGRIKQHQKKKITKRKIKMVDPVFLPLRFAGMLLFFSIDLINNILPIFFYMFISFIIHTLVYLSISICM